MPAHYRTAVSVARLAEVRIGRRRLVRGHRAEEPLHFVHDAADLAFVPLGPERSGNRSPAKQLAAAYGFADVEAMESAWLAYVRSY